MNVRSRGSNARLIVLLAGLALSGCFTTLKSKDSDAAKDSDAVNAPADTLGAGAVVEAGPVDCPGDTPTDGGSSIGGAAAGATGTAGNTGSGGNTGSSDTGAILDAAADVPAEPACSTGEHSCGGKCVSNSEPSNCGNACTACAIPQGGTATCDGTSCGGKCPDTKTLCNGVCVDKGTACSGECPEGTHPCKGLCLSSGDVTGCGPTCTVCPVPTGASQSKCENNVCGFVCSTGYHACGSTCARDDSASACGAACTVCPNDPNGKTTCSAGTCSITCNTGYHYCSEAKKCLSDSDPASCGTACTACPAITGGKATCNAGACGGECPGTQKVCNGACVEANVACGQCPAGTHNCNGICSSDTNANTCGTACTPCPMPTGAESVSCPAGTCGFTCSSGRHRCGNTCATDDDANACGSTCVKCPADPNGTPICQSGACSVRCNSGYHNCGGVCADNNSKATCGLTECTTACQAPTGGTVSCNGTACVQACPASLPQNCNGVCIAQNAACNGTCPANQKYCANSGTCVPSNGCCGNADCDNSTTGQVCNASNACVCPGGTKGCNGICIGTGACCTDTDCDNSTTGKTCNTSHSCVCSGTKSKECSGACVVANNGCCTSTECSPGYSCTNNQCACTPTIWYRDVDGDTYGDPNATQSSCTKPSNYVSRSGDCDDSNSKVHYGVAVCNGPQLRECNADGTDKSTPCKDGCYGGECRDDGTVGLAGTVTCGGTRCSISKGCNLDTSDTSAPGTCDTGSYFDMHCDGPNDCGPGQVCCVNNKNSRMFSFECRDGSSCPADQPYDYWNQACDPKQPVCPEEKPYCRFIGYGPTWLCTEYE